MKKSPTTEKSSSSSGRVESSFPSQPLERLQPPPEVQPPANDIERFVQLVATGVAAWIEAGRLLVAMHRKDEQVFRKIIGHCEWLTDDSLITFMRIGRTEMRPEVLLLKPNIAAKFMRLGYSQQSKLLDSRVEVVVEPSTNGAKPLVQQKRAAELTGGDLDLILDGAKIRTPTEQDQELKRRSRVQRMETVAPILNPSRATDEKKLMFLGNYRIVMRFGKPELQKCADLATDAQRILLKKDVGGEMAAVIELTKRSDS